jgi:hypothetical protein
VIEQRDTKWLTTYLLIGETALTEQLVANERACVQLLLWTFEKMLRPYNGAATIILLYRRWLDGDEPTAEEWSRAAAVGAADSKRHLAAQTWAWVPERSAAWAVASPHMLIGALQAAALTNLSFRAGDAKTVAEMDAVSDAHCKANIDKVRELLAS